MSEKITAKKYFEEILPTLFIPTETKGWDRVIQYHITEEGKDGDYAIEIKNQQMKATHGIYTKPDAEVTVDKMETQHGISAGTLSLMMAILRKRMAGKGSVLDQMKLGEIFKPYEPT